MASIVQAKVPYALKTKQKEFFDQLHNYSDADIIVNLPVGYGKSILYYFMPALFQCMKDIDNPIVVVISPLTIIQKEQILKAKEYGIKAARIDQDGNIDTDSGSVSVEEVIQGTFSILLCHPEGLINSQTGKMLLRKEGFRRKVIGLVIDECHVVEQWGKTFRTAFSQLKTLPAFFDGAPVIAMSGTLTTDKLKTLPATLGLIDPVIVQETPERPNIFLSKIKKASDSDVLNVYETIFIRECDKLKEHPASYPVTLMFMPLKYISHAAAYLKYLFDSCISDIPYSVIFSNQEKEVMDKTLENLQETNPRIRLILTTAVSGMGFDPPCITRVIHVCPPRNIMQYLQEIGRAGRRGQPSEAILFFSNADIKLSLPEIQQNIRDYCNSETCLRRALLAPFGFEPIYATGCACCCVCKMSCTCELCSVLIPEVVADLDAEMLDMSSCEEIETSIVPMEE